MPDQSIIRDDVRSFMTYLDIELSMSPNTVAAYRRDLNYFATWVEGGGLADFLKPTIEELDLYPAHLADFELAPATIGRHIAAIRSFYKYLHLEERCRGEIVLLLEVPTKWERIAHVLSIASVERLINSPQPDDRFYARDRAILEFFYATGSRASEVSGLKLDDLDMTATPARCRILGKGRKERTVYLHPRAVAALQAYISVRPSNPSAPTARVFLSRSRRPMSRMDLWHLVRRHGVRAKIDKAFCHPHTLRHSFATHLVSGGVNVRLVQKLLGHSNINTTQKYTHTDPVRLRAIHKLCHPRS
jgi:integrase/recombinase XerD